MKMYAIKLSESCTCERCSQAGAWWGVVPLRKIEELTKNVEMTKKQAAIILLESDEPGTIATGMILCTVCLEEFTRDS